MLSRLPAHSDRAVAAAQADLGSSAGPDACPRFRSFVSRFADSVSTRTLLFIDVSIWISLHFSVDVLHTVCGLHMLGLTPRLSGTFMGGGLNSGLVYSIWTRPS